MPPEAAGGMRRGTCPLRRSDARHAEVSTIAAHRAEPQRVRRGVAGFAAVSLLGCSFRWRPASSGAGCRSAATQGGVVFGAYAAAERKITVEPRPGRLSVTGRPGTTDESPGAMGALGMAPGRPAALPRG